jgi:hypothetical protein
MRELSTGIVVLFVYFGGVVVLTYLVFRFKFEKAINALYMKRTYS